MKKLLFAMTTVLMALAACSTQGTDENQEATAANKDNGQAAIENIMTRTSIRQYKDQPVEQEKIDIMLKAAMAAPTAVNLQHRQEDYRSALRQAAHQRTIADRCVR